LASTTISLERLIVSASQALSTLFAGECHTLLTVGGNVDHIQRRDLYSAAFYRATQLC